MNNITRAYQAVQSAHKNTGAKINILDNQQDIFKTETKTQSFGDVLKETASNFQHDAKQIEGHVKDYAMGKTNIESVALPIREFMLEFEGGVAIVKAGTEATKTILQTQI